MTFQQSHNLKTALYNRRYIFPNILTIGNLFCGFLAIIYANSARYDKAVLAVFVGILLDGLDGRVARKLNASSAFGVEFDSLADLVTFGIAPAIIMYEWCYKVMADEFGVIVCFLYVICEAARLARFNIEGTESKDFMGLPSPAAAAMVVSVVNLFPSIGIPEIPIAVATFYMVAISYLMISKVPYFSPKGIGLNNRREFLFVIAIVIAMFWYVPRHTVFFLAFAYCISGPFLNLPKIKRILGIKKIEPELNESE